jgi:hypothetical protein
MTTTDDSRPAPPPLPPGSTPLMFEAIVKQLCVATTYNRMEVTLAPHILYTRHGELYVDAVTVEREGRPPREPKLGTFKLAGMQPLRLTARRFERSALFHSAAAKYQGETLMAVEN